MNFMCNNILWRFTIHSDHVSIPPSCNSLCTAYMVRAIPNSLDTIQRNVYCIHSQYNKSETIEGVFGFPWKFNSFNLCDVCAILANIQHIFSTSARTNLQVTNSINLIRTRIKLNCSRRREILKLLRFISPAVDANIFLFEWYVPFF